MIYRDECPHHGCYLEDVQITDAKSGRVLFTERRCPQCEELERDAFRLHFPELCKTQPGGGK